MEKLKKATKIKHTIAWIMFNYHIAKPIPTSSKIIKPIPKKAMVFFNKTSPSGFMWVN